MSILASDILKETFQVLGRPSQQDLPYLDLLVLVKDVARGRVLDLKLATRNHTMTSGGWVTPTAREMSTSGFVGGLENFVPVKVEWRYLEDAAENPMPRKVDVVSFESLSEKYETATGEITHCAFYDAFANIAFSENIDVLQNRQYRIWYEDTEDVTLDGIDDSILLPSIFIPLCKYEAALMALNQVQNQSPEWADERERKRGDFTAQAMMWEQRFNQWRRNLWGSKKVSKGGVPRRYRHR